MLRSLCAVAASLIVAPLVAVPAMAQAPAEVPVTAAGDEEPYKVLVVGKTLGFRHSHIDETTQAIISLGQQNGFTVDVWDQPNSSGGWWGAGSPGQPTLTLSTTPFSSVENLTQYATIAFVSPVDNTNTAAPGAPGLLSAEELAAFQGYIRQGGGWFGVHAATDTMHNVPWFGQLIGGNAWFRNHPAQQRATMKVVSPGTLSTSFLPRVWERFDEWYNFKVNPRPYVHVLMTLDESTYNPGGGRMGADHPISWCHNFDGGRSWYQGAGHVEGAYEDEAYLAHLLAGLEWTAGKISGGGDCVTFYEVDQRLSSLGASAAVTSIGRELDLAEAYANLDRTAEALQVLAGVRSRVEALPAGAAVTTFLGKVDDLIVWQTALSEVGFRDVSATHPFADAITWASDRNITRGFEDGRFRPGANINRDAVAAMLYRAAHPARISQPECEVAPFTDVPVTHPFCGEIAWLAAEGITNGHADGTYRPGQPVTRQAIAAFLARAWYEPAEVTTCTTAPFSDVGVSHEFCGEIALLSAEGVVNGWAEDNTFRPGEAVERQAFVAFLHRHAQT